MQGHLNYSSAPQLDGGAVISDYRPASYSLPQWFYGNVDGRQVDHASLMPMAIPPLGDLRPAVVEEDRRLRDRSRGAVDRRHAEDQTPARHHGHAATARSRSHRDHSARATECRRSRSPDPEVQRRSRSRHGGSRCDDRDHTSRRREDDDDEEGRFGHRKELHGHALDHASSGRSTSERRERPRSPRGSRSSGGRRHAAVSPAVASLIIRVAPAPTLMAAKLDDDAPLSDVQVTHKLQELMRDGIANLRASLPDILRAPAPALPPRPSFQATCRSWAEAIRAAPAALLPGSSRLASPPPCSFSWPATPSAWEEADAPAAGMDGEAVDHLLPVSPLQATPACVFRPSDEVPKDWEDGVTAGTEAWFDAIDDMAALAGEVALAPLLSPARSSPKPDAATCCRGVSHGGEAPAPREVSSRILSCVDDLFDRPPVPLLPLLVRMPAPAAPARATAAVEDEAPDDRRSSRLAAKPRLSAMDKALAVLHGKMGIGGLEMPLEHARRLYVEKYKTALPRGAIQAMAALFRLNVPSIVAADDALIALAGSGGSDLPPSGLLETVA
ncbi:hypothetical protein ACQ4PT_025802 [Festuca glaucescens]